MPFVPLSFFLSSARCVKMSQTSSNSYKPVPIQIFPGFSLPTPALPSTVRRLPSRPSARVGDWCHAFPVPPFRDARSSKFSPSSEDVETSLPIEYLDQAGSLSAKIVLFVLQACCCQNQRSTASFQCAAIADAALPSFYCRRQSFGEEVVLLGDFLSLNKILFYL